MARRGKLEKFAALLTYAHVLETVEPMSELVRQFVDKTLNIKNEWCQEIFNNDHNICVELACGRGEYTIALSRLHPERNFIGVDIKGARIFKGAKIAKEENLTNVAFLRTRIEYLDCFFGKGEINEIWITFPDPFPAKENRRLTAPIFLDKYFDLLSNTATIHLKTDDDELFYYSVESVQNHDKYFVKFTCENIAEIRLDQPELNISTYYEQRHLLDKKTIKYLQIGKID